MQVVVFAWIAQKWPMSGGGSTGGGGGDGGGLVALGAGGVAQRPSTEHWRLMVKGTPRSTVAGARSAQLTSLELTEGMLQ